MNFFNSILNIVALMCNIFTKLLDIITVPLSDLLGMVPNIPLISGIIDIIIENTFLGDITLLSIMIGEMLLVYVVWQLGSWITNILT